MNQATINKAIDVAINSIIADQEGLATVLPDGRIQAYWDSKGKVWTIGRGNTYYEDGSAVKEGDIISRDQAEKLFRTIVAQKEKAIRPYVTRDLNYNQYASLIDIAFNCGEGRVQRSDLLKLINDNAPIDQIEAQFLVTCVTAKGEKLSVLYNRRKLDFAVYAQQVRDIISAHPEISIATGLAIFSLTAYTLYRYAKSR